MKGVKVVLAERADFTGPAVEEIERTAMAEDFVVMCQRLADDGQAVAKDAKGFALGKVVSFERGGDTRPAGAKLLQENFAQAGSKLGDRGTKRCATSVEPRVGDSIANRFCKAKRARPFDRTRLRVVRRVLCADKADEAARGMRELP